ncbi:glycosyltransferase family 2 protein [Catenulispora pinisilvae]|uniref:glycosyltransferase family 2 protein n=1 Tax=Catenulispora pinisilvae TaxID=2705253 RepID=UPI001E645A76|nr:glycosyltransferase family 2 protein [Catenulispora pinisilvae]
MGMARNPVRWGKDTANQLIGWQVIFEWRNRTLNWPSVLRMRRFEDREVRRLRGETPLLSASAAVVIPTYKRPEGLAAAVRSALGQTWSDLVVVVVDDGGGGLEAADLPADPRLRTVSLSANSHVLGLVRNVGMRLTASRYVAFLDDDNVWEPDHLALAIKALADSPNLAGVYTALHRVLPDGTDLDVLSVPFDRKRASWDSFLDCNAFVAIRTRALTFSRMPRPIGLLPREDWEMMYRFTRRHHITHLPVPTVRYLVNPSSFYTQWDKDGPARQPAEEGGPA